MRTVRRRDRSREPALFGSRRTRHHGGWTGVSLWCLRGTRPTFWICPAPDARRTAYGGRIGLAGRHRHVEDRPEDVGDRAGSSQDLCPAEHRLTLLVARPILRRHHEERAVNGTSTRRTSAERPGVWWKPGRRRRRMDPGASGPNGRGEAKRPRPSRLRRRAPAIQGSADRQGTVRQRGTPDPGRRSRKCGIAE
jgi:hypothetical protein